MLKGHMDLAFSPKCGHEKGPQPHIAACDCHLKCLSLLSSREEAIDASSPHPFSRSLLTYPISLLIH